MKNDLISVIIPVYKVEQYLSECIESVINQTYKNIEILLIDDGSPDKCGQICDEYSSKDSRIITIHKKNEGVSAARNTALDIAKGKYISFLDSDDFMALDALENLYNDLINNNADISCGNTGDFDDIKPYSYVTIWKKEKVVIEGSVSILKTFFDEKMGSCVSWSRLYKSELIGKHRFNPNLNLAEDFDFLYKLLGNAKRMIINNTIVTNYYRVRKSSLAHFNNKYNPKFEDEIRLNKEAIEFVKENYPEVENNVIHRLQKCCLKNIIRYYKTNHEVKGAKHLFNIIDSYKTRPSLVFRIKIFSLKYLSPFLNIYFFIMDDIIGKFKKKKI